MRRIEIQTREERDGTAEGADHETGKIVITLEGVDHLDEGARFFLRPLDAIAQGEDLGALADEQHALEVRHVANGVELVLGPDVTRHPALLPGSAVEIEVPDIEVWSEFNWPALRMAPRPRQIKGLSKRLTGSPMDRSTLGMQSGIQSGVTANSTSQAHGQAGGDSVPDAPAPGTLQEEAVAMTNAYPATEPHVHDGPHDGPPAAGQEYVVFYPHARGGKLGAAPDRGDADSRRAKSLLPSTRLGAAAMAVAAVLGIQGLMWTANSGASSTATVAPTVPTSSVAGGEASFYDLFAVGPVSPRGVQAGNVGTGKSLENAQAALLTPGAPRDADEGACWLRRFITSGGSDERTRRVLTQLGTAFADGTNRPADYGKARQVWEIAGAFGDPVAMCFLGTLHENGLGTIADRRTALQWYERAKLAGGCASVDESIARVRK